MQIDWTEPFTGGSPVVGYRIYIRQSDGVTYSLELNDCDGASSQVIIDAQSCSVQVTTLRGAPFNLPWGSSVHAKVVAFNIYGDSEESDSGNGAVIITYADAPYGLTETVASRAADSITFSWTEGAANGGSAVTGYKISSDLATGGTFSVIDTGITETFYTSTGLTAGQTYIFKIEAENEFGFSSFSEQVAILCATIPSKIATPSTTVVNSDVIFDWDVPSSNGLPITSYTVTIRKSDLVYAED